VEEEEDRPLPLLRATTILPPLRQAAARGAAAVGAARLASRSALLLPAEGSPMSTKA